MLHFLVRYGTFFMSRTHVSLHNSDTEIEIYGVRTHKKFIECIQSFISLAGDRTYEFMVNLVSPQET